MGAKRGIGGGVQPVPSSRHSGSGSALVGARSSRTAGDDDNNNNNNNNNNSNDRSSAEESRLRALRMAEGVGNEHGVGSSELSDSDDSDDNDGGGWKEIVTISPRPGYRRPLYQQARAALGSGGGGGRTRQEGEDFKDDDDERDPNRVPNLMDTPGFRDDAHLYFRTGRQDSSAGSDQQNDGGSSTELGGVAPDSGALAQRVMQSPSMGLGRSATTTQKEIALLLRRAHACIPHVTVAGKTEEQVAGIAQAKDYLQRAVHKLEVSVGRSRKQQLPQGAASGSDHLREVTESDLQRQPTPGEDGHAQVQEIKISTVGSGVTKDFDSPKLTPRSLLRKFRDRAIGSGGVGGFGGVGADGGSAPQYPRRHKKSARASSGRGAVGGALSAREEKMERDTAPHGSAPTRSRKLPANSDQLLQMAGLLVEAAQSGHVGGEGSRMDGKSSNGSGAAAVAAESPFERMKRAAMQEVLGANAADGGGAAAATAVGGAGAAGRAGGDGVTDGGDGEEDDKPAFLRKLDRKGSGITKDYDSPRVKSRGIRGSRRARTPSAAEMAASSSGGTFFPAGDDDRRASSRAAGVPGRPLQRESSMDRLQLAKDLAARRRRDTNAVDPPQSPNQLHSAFRLTNLARMDIADEEAKREADREMADKTPKPAFLRQIPGLTGERDSSSGGEQREGEVEMGGIDDAGVASVSTQTAKDVHERTDILNLVERASKCVPLAGRHVDDRVLQQVKLLLELAVEKLEGFVPDEEYA